MITFRQNLNTDHLGNRTGSMWTHGRATFEKWRHEFKAEWLLGRRARNFAMQVTFGGAHDDSGVMLHVCIPFIFSIFCGVAGIVKCEEHKVGIAIHNGSFWLYRWKRNHAWHFPWNYDWYSTEILEHKANLPGLAKAIYTEKRHLPFKLWCANNEGKEAIKAASETYDYTYVLKNGNVQKRKATVYAERMTWRMRWWPLLPFTKVRTSIDVAFDGEVGEGSGSWKGGAVGCGYTMLHGETPLECLRRMERERKFR